MNNINLVNLIFRMVTFHQTAKLPSQKRSAATLNAYYQKKELCVEFLNDQKLMKIKAVDFNKKIADSYLSYLLEKGYKYNYAVRCVEFVGMATSFGASQEFLNKDPLLYYSLKRTEPKKPTYYLPGQIKAWENFKSEDINEVNTANLAVLQMHTGFDFGDFAEVKRDHKMIFKGRAYLLKPRQKNGYEAIIPLSDKAEAILEYYNYKLDLISNAKYNGLLKVIANRLGIDIYINSKELRKIFIMDQLNNKCVPLAAVSKMGGHKRIATTEKHYAQVNIYLISNELDKLGL